MSTQDLKSRQRSTRVSGSDFACNSSGSAAAELALIAIPFFGIIFTIFEIGLFYFFSSRLQIAAELSSRDLMTGSLAPGTTVEKFIETKLCQSGGPLYGLMDCAKLRIDVSNPHNWKSADVSNNTSAFGTNRQAVIVPPAAGGIGILRIGYPLPKYFGFMGVGNTKDVKFNDGPVRMIMGIAAFRVEK